MDTWQFPNHTMMQPVRTPSTVPLQKELKSGSVRLTLLNLHRKCSHSYGFFTTELVLVVHERLFEMWTTQLENYIV